MSTSIPSRLSFTGTIRAGQTVQARWIVGHPMHTGLRVDDRGQPIPRHIIVQVWVWLDDTLVMEFETGSALSANPYIEFPIVVPAQGGIVRVEWLDDRGQRGRVQRALAIEP